MAENSTTPSSKPVAKEDPRGIGAIFHKLKLAVTVLLGSLLLSLIVEWIGIALVWPEQGYRHSQDMLEVELGWLSKDFTRSLVLSEPVKTGQALVSDTYQRLFVKTGFIAFVTKVRPPTDTSPLQRHHGTDLFVTLKDYLLATVYVTLIFLIRLVILALTTPLFVMAALVGMVDGLVRRDLRRFGAGRESGFVYHHAKRTIVPLFFSAWVIYLSLPFSLHPNWVLLPCAGMLGLAISVTAGSFKKYL